MKQLELGEIRNGFPVLKREERKTILLLSDDIQFPSGVGTIARQIVLSTCHYFNWIQIGGSMNHPHEGKRISLNDAIIKEIGVKDPQVEIFCVNGYGNQQIVRDIINANSISAIMHITDPRFWVWLYQMRGEIETKCPLIYLDLWDDLPIPLYNEPFYRSCDLLLNINRQTHQLMKSLLKNDVFDLYEKEYDLNDDKLPILIDYIPHGQDPLVYFKIDKDNEDIQKLKKFLFKEKANDIKFICLYNNRNIRRKMVMDIMLAFRDFCNKQEGRKESCALILHTDARDDNGTDLPVVIEDLFNDVNIVLFDKKIPLNEMNFLYNLADVTINIASNEGFGLSSLESLMAGTMVINNVTGGLQDQMRFENEEGEWIKLSDDFISNHAGKYKKCGEWAIPVFPISRSLQGSIPTPYIFDDRCDWEDVSNAIEQVYNLSSDERNKRGLTGREWVSSLESRMSTLYMSFFIMKNITLLLNKWKPIRKLEVISINKEISKKRNINMGILNAK